MKQRRSFLLVLLLTIFSCPLRSQTHADEQTLVRGNSSFAFDLYQQLRSNNGNLFFSPYSISQALAMAYAGARGNTEAQMKQALHFTLPQEVLHPAFAGVERNLSTIANTGDIELAAANSLWPQKGRSFRPEYIDLVQRFYSDTINYVDYRLAHGETARGMINEWVEERTHDRIRDLIPRGGLSDSSYLTLVNAIYFKGKWQNQFTKTLTKDAPFYLTSQEEVKTPFMTQQGEFMYTEADQCQILELPYRGGELSMIILLPPKTTPLGEMESTLSSDRLDSWRGQLKKRTVIMFIPKFTATEELSLGRVLGEMGMIDAFNPRRADFSGITEDWALFSISAVLHKAFVDVAEEGTEAAAATALLMPHGEAYIPQPPPPVVFRADHPFVFLIQEKKSGSILFLGRLTDPTK